MHAPPTSGVTGQVISAPASAELHPATRLEGRARIAAQAMWLTLLGLCVGLLLASIPERLAQLQTVTPEGNLALAQLSSSEAALLSQAGISQTVYALYFLLVELLFAAGFIGIGAAIFWRKSDDWLLLFVSFTLIAFGSILPPLLRALDTPASPYSLPVHLVQVLGWSGFFIFFYIFPDGKFVPRGTRFAPIAFFAYGIAWLVFPPANMFNWPLPLAVLLLGAVLAVGVGAQVYRYRRVSTVAQRQQTKWIVFGFAGAAVTVLLFAVAGLVTPTFHQPGAPRIWYIVGGISLVAFSMLLVPITIDIAIRRSRLWQIDPLLNRTIVYVGLTAILAGLISASTSVLQKIFLALTGQASDMAIVLSTLMVVALFEPIKKKLQAFVDRHFKYAAGTFGEFGAQVRAFVQMLDAQYLTRRLLDEAVDAFDAKDGAIFLKRGGSIQRVHTAGKWNEEPHLRVALEHDGETFGEIVLGARRNGAEYSASDRASLEQMAAMIAKALDVAARP